jgi:FKBP-type peptidyl-prolyl cis-trans isomerase
MVRLLRFVPLAVGVLLTSAACNRATSVASSASQPETGQQTQSFSNPRHSTPIAHLAQPALRSEDVRSPPDVRAPPLSAHRTASGLAYTVLRPGRREPKPSLEDVVEVKYSGWTTDGHMFDSSVGRSEPARFPLRGVIKGWTEGLQLMTVGAKYRFWIPSHLAYGDSPGGRTPAGMLVFDIELLAVIPALRAPADAANAPPRAKKTPSGIRYRVLVKGTGREHPEPDSIVTIHYSGWTPDGKLFDSSVAREQPIAFPVNGAIRGWTEAVELMVVGEKARFWIPGALAYDSTLHPGTPPGTPHGALVFDIELLAIKEASAARTLSPGDPD